MFSVTIIQYNQDDISIFYFAFHNGHNYFCTAKTKEELITTIRGIEKHMKIVCMWLNNFLIN